MISPERFYQHLLAQGVEFYTGIPDSLMKDLLLYLQEHVEQKNHVIVANEGLAVALATGYHLSTGRLPLVYLQNSGLGNAVNPLTSLTDKDIYSVPMLLLIGWRGKPGEPDEPQHKKMGRITEQLLDVLEIPFFLLEDKEDVCISTIDKAVILAKERKQPVALLVTSHLFNAYNGTVPFQQYSLSRYQVLEKLYDHLHGDETVICTTGKTGREFYELNRKKNKRLSKEFLCVGGMGLANHVALGIDQQCQGRIVMLDGDGALLMHMGALTTTGKLARGSFVHIVINNGCHESVGGQPTTGLDIDLCAVARAVGYGRTFCITNEEQLFDWMQHEYKNEEQKQFVEVRVSTSGSGKPGRPEGSPQEWKDELMKALKK